MMMTMVRVVYSLCSLNNDIFSALVRLQNLLQLRAIGKLSIRLIKFSAGDDYRIFWKAIQNSGERRVILDCDPDILKNVILTSVEYGIMDQFNVSISAVGLEL